MDFKEQKDVIIKYIEDNFNLYLGQYDLNVPKITEDFIDFDKFKHDFILFIECDTINFLNTFNDDCSETERLLMNFYLVFRNDTPINLNEKMLNASSAFGTLIKEFRLDFFLSSNINNINFFKYIEGSTNIVASKFTVQFEIEI
jgi:hypothetical protein